MNTCTTWLCTINEDGSPHVTPVGALWLDGAFWFQTGAGTRKGRNVARDQRCSIALSIRNADVVVEGDAARVTEPSAVARVARARADNGWPVEPDESGSGITAPFNAPALGPPPWNVYRVDPRSAIVALGTEPGGLFRSDDGGSKLVLADAPQSNAPRDPPIAERTGEGEQVLGAGALGDRVRERSAAAQHALEVIEEEDDLTLQTPWQLFDRFRTSWVSQP